MSKFIEVFYLFIGIVRQQLEGWTVMLTLVNNFSKHTADGDDDEFPFDSPPNDPLRAAAASSSRWRRNLIKGIRLAAVCRSIETKTIFISDWIVPFVRFKTYPIAVTFNDEHLWQFAMNACTRFDVLAKLNSLMAELFIWILWLPHRMQLFSFCKTVAVRLVT